MFLHFPHPDCSCFWHRNSFMCREGNTCFLQQYVGEGHSLLTLCTNQPDKSMVTPAIFLTTHQNGGFFKPWEKHEIFFFCHVVFWFCRIADFFFFFLQPIYSHNVFWYKYKAPTKRYISKQRQSLGWHHLQVNNTVNGMYDGKDQFKGAKC